LHFITIWSISCWS